MVDYGNYHIGHTRLILSTPTAVFYQSNLQNRQKILSRFKWGEDNSLSVLRLQYFTNRYKTITQIMLLQDDTIEIHFGNDLSFLIEVRDAKYLTICTNRRTASCYPDQIFPFCLRKAAW